MRAALLLLTLLATPVLAQSPAVVAVTPTGGTLGIDPATSVEIEFDRALHPASVSNASFRVFGRWSGVHEGTLTLEAGDTRIRFVPDAPFFFGEAVSIQLSRGIASASGTPLASPFATMFWTGGGSEVVPPFAEVGTLDLRRPGEGSIISYGAYAGDLDEDGSSDLAVPNENPSDVRVLLNDGTGNYGPMSVHQLVDPGSLPSTSEGTDLNGDGHIDILVGHGGNNKLSVMLGDGVGGFIQIDAYTLPGNGIRGLAVFDADGDGDEDVIAAARFTSNLVYLEGNGDGTLQPGVPFDALCDGETALAAADANADGRLDLFVGCITSREIALLLGNGDGSFSFSEKILTPGGPWMIGAGDLDGDGDADVASAGSNGNSLDVVFGNGAGGFTGSAVSVPSGQFTIAVDLGDLDNDGDLDAVTSNFSSNDFIVYLNDGTGAFTQTQRLLADGAGSCAVIHDRDGDGQAVEITGIDEIADRLFFYEWNDVLPSTTVPEIPPSESTLQVLGNPAQGSVRLRLALDAVQTVRLTVLDLLGREVAVLIDAAVGEGEHTVHWNAAGRAAGHYLLRLETEAETLTRQITLVR